MALPLLIGAIAERITDRTLRRSTDERRRTTNDMLKTAIGFIGISSAIVTGIVLSNQRDALVAGSSNVAAEAAAISDLHEVAHFLPVDEDRQLQSELERYVSAEAGPGWRALRLGRSAPQAEAAYQALGALILSLRQGTGTNSSSLPNTAFSSWLTIGQLRADRLEIANRQLAPELWWLLVGTGLLTVIAVAGLTSDDRTDRLATLAAALTVGLVLFAAVGLSYPFSGSISVSPAPILKAVQHE